MGLFSKLKRSNTLYFPGCIAYYKEKNNFLLWKDIFSRLGIDYKTIDKNVCCGLPALVAGYDSDARKLARRNFEIFKEEKIDRIITTCPVCFKMFKEDYKKYLPDWNIEILNIWNIILEKLQEKPGLIKNKENTELGFQDSCYLGRYSGIYEEPREILEMIGYKIKEMKDNRENALCSGSCGGLPLSNPLLADKTAKERLLQAKRIGIKKLIVCSLEEYYLLNKNSSGMGLEILEFSEVLGFALGIKKQDNVISDSPGSEDSRIADSVDSKIAENLKIAEEEVE
jgi:heterodisulfide reductase subunit D